MGDLDFFIVHYIDRLDGDFIQYFDCMAETADHAREQCENAYPTAIIVSVDWHDQN
jgi:hypothetical protein